MAGTLNTPAITDPVKANGFYSFVVTIPDDDVYSFTPKGTCGQLTLATTSSNHQGIFWWRGSAASKLAGGPETFAANTTLNGITDGNDGRTTLGASGGVLYIENRSGGALEYVVTLLTENAGYE